MLDSKVIKLNDMINTISNAKRISVLFSSGEFLDIDDNNKDNYCINIDSIRDSSFSILDKNTNDKYECCFSLMYFNLSDEEFNKLLSDTYEKCFCEDNLYYLYEVYTNDKRVFTIQQQKVLDKYRLVQYNNELLELETVINKYEESNKKYEKYIDINNRRILQFKQCIEDLKIKYNIKGE